MRTLSIVGFLVAAAIAVAACGSSTTGQPFSGTDCPAFGVTSSSCVSCMQSSCASNVSSMNSACTSTEFSCGCPSGANLSKCTLSSACASAGQAWSSCISAKCSSTCFVSSGGGSGSSSGGTSSSGGGSCGEPSTGCPASETSATKRSGCCASSACTSGTGTLSSCADSCSNGWYETNGTLYGPCATSDSACLQTAAGNAVANCK